MTVVFLLALRDKKVVWLQKASLAQPFANLSSHLMKRALVRY